MFNTTMRKVGGGTYSHCFKCSLKHREAKEAANVKLLEPKRLSRKHKPSSLQLV
jgi:hypothetical protein